MSINVNDEATVVSPSSQRHNQSGAVSFATPTHVWIAFPDGATIPYHRGDVRKRVAGRIEGQAIKFSDVLIGDVVETTQHSDGDGVETVIIKTGTVGSKHENNILRTRGGVMMSSIDSVIKLVKDINSDEVMVDLKELPRESIITFRTGCKSELTVALKLGEDAWNLMSGANNKSIKTLALRETIRKLGNDTYTVVQIGAK